MTRLQQGQRVLHAVSLGLCGIAGGALAFGITAHPDFLMSSGLICIGMLSIGCLLFWGAETWFQSELVIDPHRQEIRILRRHPSGRQDIVMKRGFGSLSGVAIGTRDLTVMDRNGQRVAHYVVPDQKMLAELRCTLGQHLQVLP
ncbi:hypothetical protein GFB49_00425 [Epibacterium sp. SM1979]|uniref:Uncharacterized protein n=1 Tax=Tritonibacter litoralis TaxID=2662264 RepID=A0A843YCX4_9RHOB|nr:hypothetical protein [Tritonibacter litoralis]MQQ06909.1 hypothetical protein [Tritonibacter litoralis]